MELIAIDALTLQRNALAAPEAERLAVFGEAMKTTLAPFWEPFLRWGPPVDEAVDPALQAARRFGFYSPEQDIQAGLAALDRFTATGTWPATVAAMEQSWAALAPAAHGVTLPAVRYTFLLGDPAKLDARTDYYTGVGGFPGTVLGIAWPTDTNLPRIPAVMAHELHHNVRFSYEPFMPQQVTVGQYIVAEGLAEAFAAEQYGEAMLHPVTTILNDEQITALLPRYSAALNEQGFDVSRAYIFGDWAAQESGYPAMGIPDFAGYCVGYRVVQAFLQQQGISAVAATYLPWQEIAAGSGLV